jgi:hypothetical protein
MNDKTLIVFAAVAAMALVGGVAITLVTIPSLLQLQQAEAEPGAIVGCPVNGTEEHPAPPAFQHSQGHCLHF